MIGGSDIVFSASGGPASLEGCARIVWSYWPNIRFEDAVTGDKFSRLGDIPVDRVGELLAYRDADSEAAWDADSSDSPENSMLYLIVRADDITVIVDDPNTPEMRSMLGAIRDWLQQQSSGPPGRPQHLPIASQPGSPSS